MAQFLEHEIEFVSDYSHQKIIFCLIKDKVSFDAECRLQSWYDIFIGVPSGKKVLFNVMKCKMFNTKIVDVSEPQTRGVFSKIYIEFYKICCSKLKKIAVMGIH